MYENDSQGLRDLEAILVKVRLTTFRRTLLFWRRRWLVQLTNLLEKLLGRGRRLSGAGGEDRSRERSGFALPPLSLL